MQYKGENTNLTRDFFVYTSNFLSIAPGVTQTQQVNILADSAFLIQKICYAADIAAAAQTDSTRVLPLCTLLLTDTASGRQLSDAAVPITSMLGDGRLPFILPTGKLMLPNSTLTLVVNNFSVATTYAIRIAFMGLKLFK